MNEQAKKEVSLFLRSYEIAANTYNFENVRPLIALDAVYFFSDQTLNGISEIEQAFIHTWSKLNNDTYKIVDVRWIEVTERMAACVYRFEWTTVINGLSKSGSGRGTNVLKKVDDSWLVLHEHLSSL